MNIIDRDRKFREAEEALEHAIRAALRTQRLDPLSLTFLFVHRSAASTYRALLANGGTECGGGFAIAIGQRSLLPNDPLIRLPADHIACMISIGEHHKALGLPLDVLGICDGGDA